MLRGHVTHKLLKRGMEAVDSLDEFRQLIGALTRHADRPTGMRDRHSNLQSVADRLGEVCREVPDLEPIALCPEPYPLILSRLGEPHR